MRNRVVQNVCLEVERRVHAMLENPVCTDLDADDALHITRYMSYKQISTFCRLTFVDFLFHPNKKHVNCFPQIMWSFENNFQVDHIRRLGTPQIDKRDLLGCEHHLKISAILALSQARSNERTARLNVFMEYETPVYFDHVNRMNTSSFDPRSQSRFVGVGLLLCEIVNLYDHVDIDIYVKAFTVKDYVITPMQKVVLDFLEAHHKDYTARIFLETTSNNPTAIVPTSIHHLHLSEANCSNRYLKYVVQKIP